MASSTEQLPRVLILGGVGFVGRHLTAYLIEEKLASKVRVVDKVPPATGWLNKAHAALFKHDAIEFKQANLANPSSAEKAFASDDGPFDFVYNLAAETKYGQSEEVYKERVLTVAINCAQQAAKTGVKRFVHVSTAQIYNSDKGISQEESKVDPWTLVAKYHLKAEQELKSIENLIYVIVRPAIIYGVADKLGLTPRLITAACYKQLGEKMKLLWSKDLRMNTVHVRDVVRALWHLRDAGPPGQIYNLADKGETTQGIISELVSRLFDIEHGYHGSVISNLAKLHMAGATETSNEKHLGPWSEACSKDGIVNTPLSPYIDQELLYNRHLHIDGTKIENVGFIYEVGRPTLDLLREVVDDYIVSGLFPPSLVPPASQ